MWLLIKHLLCLFLCFGFGAAPSVSSAYFWLCAQESIMAGLGDHAMEWTWVDLLQSKHSTCSDPINASFKIKKVNILK